MEICNGGTGKYKHDEIAHTERDCPLCLMMTEKADLESKILELNKEIDDLNSEE